MFIASFVMAAIAFCVYANLSDEVPRLFTLGIVLICFILDLILAPWPVQLLALCLVLAGSQKLMPSGFRS